MGRNLFLIILFFSGFYFCAAQSKKVSKLPQKKTVPLKSATTNNAKIKPKPKPIPIQKADSLPKKVVIIEKKEIEKPINGPIQNGPQSYSIEKKSEKVDLKKNDLKLPKNKRKLNTKNWAWGVQLGVNAANMKNFSKMVYSGVNIPAHKPIYRFIGGFSIQYNITKTFILQPEIQYSQQGSQIKDSLNKYQFKVNFINVPLLLKTQIGKGKLKYNIIAGTYFGYALSKKSTRFIGGQIINSKIEFEKDFNAFGEKDNRFDWGAIGGFGGQYKYKKLLLSTEFRYQLGFANPIIYKSDLNKTSLQTGRQRVLSAHLGIYYPF